MGLSEEEKVDDEKVKSGVSRNALMLICVGPMSGILLKTDWVSNLDLREPSYNNATNVRKA